MQSMDDGYVRYRNDPFPSDRLIPLDPQREAKYRIKVFGVASASAELRNDNGCPVVAIGDGEDTPTLRLGQYRPGIYFSPDGEALDLTRDPPTYANVKLYRVE